MSPEPASLPRRRDPFGLPILLLGPEARFALLATLPLGIFAKDMWPTIAGVFVVALPWRAVPMAPGWVRSGVFLAVVVSLGWTAWLLSVDGWSGAKALIPAGRLGASILLLVLTAKRFEAAISTVDAIAIVVRLGGRRAVLVSIIATIRMADILEAAWKQTYYALRAKGILDRFWQMRTLRRTVETVLVHFLESFFLRVDTLALTIDLRLGSKEKLEIAVDRGRPVLDVAVFAVCIGYAIWIF